MEKTNATKMNMEEKKKLEKLAIEDINRAVNVLQGQKQKAIGEFQDKPSKENVALIDKYNNLTKEAEKIKKILEDRGYSVYSGKLSLNTYSNANKELEAIRNKFDKKIEAVNGMRRDIIIGLYTNGVEARDFLQKLANDIAKILK